MILALLVAALVAWWGWKKGFSRQHLIAAASAVGGAILLLKGAWQVAIPMFLPAVWMLVRDEKKPGAGPAPKPAMDIEEAHRILGISADADADGIREAHRRLVTRVHPDQGGSEELAQRVNAARDLLLAERAGRYPR